MAITYHQRGDSGRPTATPTFPAGKFGEAVAGVLLAEENVLDFLASSGSTTTLGAIEGTIEFWVKTTDSGSLRVLAARDGWFWVAHDGSGQLAFNHGPTPGTTINSTAVINDGAWHHVALVSTGTGAISLYSGTSGTGQRVATVSSSTPTTATTPRLSIGGLWSFHDFDSTGTYDDLRVSNVARYSGTTYTVPSAPFTSDANTVTLHSFNQTSSTPVTATAPTKNDQPGTVSDTYTIPNVTGVEYRVGGTAKTAGTHPTGGASSVTVTAVALSGYTLTGTSSWTLTFDTTVDPGPDPEPDPETRYRLAFEPLIWTGSAYPPRHPGAASVTYIGPSQPPGWQPNDLWVETT